MDLGRDDSLTPRKSIAAVGNRRWALAELFGWCRMVVEGFRVVSKAVITQHCSWLREDVSFFFYCPDGHTTAVNITTAPIRNFRDKGPVLP